MQAHEKLQLISFLTGQRDKNIIVLPKKICRLGGWSRLFKVACMSELHDTSSIDNVPLIQQEISVWILPKAPTLRLEAGVQGWTGRFPGHSFSAPVTLTARSYKTSGLPIVCLTVLSKSF